jgi:hypothetical protein
VRRPYQHLKFSQLYLATLEAFGSLLDPLAIEHGVAVRDSKRHHLVGAVERRVPRLVELDVSFAYVPLGKDLSNAVVKATLRSKSAQCNCEIFDFTLRITKASYQTAWSTGAV